MTRKYIYVAIFFLFCACRASAQFTLVTGTVKDVNGLAYSCGSISASIVNLNGQNLYLNGAAFSPQPGASKLGCPTDPTTSTTPGAFTMQLADNTQIKCGSGANIVNCATQTQWIFIVNTTGVLPPLGTGSQTCSTQLTISGASLTLTALQTCPALSTTGGGALPSNVVNASNPSFNGGVQGFTHIAFAPNVTYTTGSRTITIAGALFSSGNLGQHIFCTNKQIVTDQDYPLVTDTITGTISTILTTTSVSVGAGDAAATSNSDATHGWCAYGPYEDPALTSSGNAAMNPSDPTQPCLVLQLPAGYIMTQTGHWNSATCPGGGTGSLSQFTGVSGWPGSVVSTHIVIDTATFNWATCTGTVNGGGPKCFMGVRGSSLLFLSFDGLGSSLNCPAGSVDIIGSEIDGTYEHLMVLGVGPTCSTISGFAMGAAYHDIHDITIDGTGAGTTSGTNTGSCYVPANANSHLAFGIFCGNGNGLSLNIGANANFVCSQCFWQVSPFSNTGSTAVDISGTMTDDGGSSLIGNVAHAENTYIVRSGGTLYLHHGNHSNTGTGGQQYVVNVVSGGHAMIRDNGFLQGPAAFAMRHCPAGAVCLDGGGNTYSGTISDTLPTLTSTGTGTTPCVPVLDTGSRNEGGSATCTLSAGTAATGTFTLNLEGTFELFGGTNPPTCTGTLSNGTATITGPVSVWLNAPPTTTAATFNWSAGAALPTTNNIKFAWSCTPR